jgi:hypothetical protein
MISVGMMQPSAHEVIDMVAMGHSFVPAGRAMLVRATRLRRALHGIGGIDWDHVLVNVIPVHVVKMAVMEIIDMAFMADRRMPTFGTVFMGMVGMVLLVTGSHRIFSFLLLRSGEPADYCLSAARSMVPANAERECRKASSRCALRRLLTRPPPRDPNSSTVLASAQAAARIAGLVIVPAKARNRADIQSAFATFAGERVGAIMVSPDATFLVHRQRIAELAIQSRLPSMFVNREYVEAGGLMSYGENLKDFFRRKAG